MTFGSPILLSITLTNASIAELRPEWNTGNSSNMRGLNRKGLPAAVFFRVARD